MDGNTWRTMRLIRIPAALPALASGLRVATAVAPIGAIVGEWVGSSAGLGYFMLQANARLQVDAMFAALFLLAVFAVLLFTLVDRLLRRAMSWQADDATRSSLK
jgi:putative hydroxymethylpyrimidine transport system permease protein